MNLRYLSMSQIAEVTGLDRRTVKARLAQLKPHKIEGKAHIYDCHEAIMALMNPGDISKQMAEESLMLERARREKAQLEVAKLRGEQVPIEDVCNAVEKEYTYVRATLLSIPPRKAKALSLEVDPSKINAILKEEINEALAHLQADTRFQNLSQGDISETDISITGEDDPS